MNENKRDELLRGQTTTAQKVFTAVPISESWSVELIHNELSRNGAVARIDRKVLSGCLKALVEAGVAKETSLNHYCRAPVTPRVGRPPMPKEEYAVTNHSKITPPAAEPAEQDTGLAKRIKTLAADMRDMSEQAKHISDELELLSMELKDRAVEDEKLKQLRSLLKSL